MVEPKAIGEVVNIGNIEEISILGLAERVKAIQDSLATATGRSVDITTKIDPSIIGGMVARVGGTVFDASVTSHLQRLRQRLDASI